MVCWYHKNGLRQMVSSMQTIIWLLCLQPGTVPDSQYLGNKYEEKNKKHHNIVVIQVISFFFSQCKCSHLKTTTTWEIIFQR